ncbi:protein indeterminate-domain 7-like [Curcuma longa]|uniref:protein indeterminate-domain 7-like n=1 Tax=Curcuma longa TaxID=136217 RepID=UPI003D9DC848
MMKGMRITQQQHELAMVEENMSNLTSAASGEASFSSNNPAQNKKKRNLPGNPDPEAEVVALSPQTLMVRNRFLCEICSKGFQREQNLQLHRRGHNLPWKLKQRKEMVRKKVYVCPEASCVHHDPARALGDLTGIKKHFSRKHGEKKWKCDKCSKKYAVQSDWKAHSKICGTKEYKCECGTLFSRKDSFITHRAFCDALAKETASVKHHQSPLQFPQDSPSSLLHLQQQLPPWQGSCSSGLTQIDQLTNAAIYHPPANYNLSPHMSATALLQKASEMGATMSRPSNLISSSAMFVGHGGRVENMVMSSLTSTTAPELMDGSCFRDAFEGMEGIACHGVTRDFLGLQGLPQRSIFKLHGLEQQQHQQSKKPWHG